MAWVGGGLSAPTEPASELPRARRTVPELVDAYQRFGYQAAELDPLGLWDNSGWAGPCRASLLQEPGPAARPAAVGAGDRTGRARPVSGHRAGAGRPSGARLLRQGGAGVQAPAGKCRVPPKKPAQSLEEHRWLERRFEQLQQHEFEPAEKKRTAELMLKALVSSAGLSTPFRPMRSSWRQRSRR